MTVSIILAACLLTGVLLLNFVAYKHAYAMLHFQATGKRTARPEALGGWQKLRVLITGVNIPRPASEFTPEDLAPGCRVISIEEKGNIRLEAWYCDRGPSTPLVILFHGYSAEKTSLLEEARTILDLGASVLLVDFRGSGGSSESYTTIGVHEADDVNAVCKYANANLKHCGTVLFGQSMGAAAILRAVSVHDIHSDAIILESVFDTLINTVRNRFRSMRLPSFPAAELMLFWGGRQWRFDGFTHNPVEYAKSVKCRALFLHGGADPRAKLSEGRSVFDSVPGADKEFIVFKDSGHEAYVATHKSEWRSAVKKTIEAACTGKTVRDRT